MDELNSIEARKLDPITRMKTLQKALLLADAKNSVRQAMHGKAMFWTKIGFGVPVLLYYGYHAFAPYGFIQRFHYEKGVYHAFLSNIFNPTHSLIKIVFIFNLYYYPEVDKKLETMKFYSVDYTIAGVEFHPISKAFMVGKKEGQEEVKNFVPYMWN